jgi:NADPH-dependent glutamate synthase beta subunit-like oxidoreductase
MAASPLEKLRRVWTPDREILEVIAALDPRTELDSMLRDWLHRVIEQTGPKTVVLGIGETRVVNTGTLRWEVVHHEPTPGIPGRREVTLWIEGAETF